jgi:hypothetical protein
MTERRHVPEDGKLDSVIVRKSNLKQVLNYRNLIPVSDHCALIGHTKAIFINWACFRIL